MKLAIFVIFIFWTAPSLAEMGFPEETLIGKYVLIGKAIDSENTYIGKVEILAKNDKLVVIRRINGSEVTGVAAIESALDGDAKVLRIRFTDKKIKLEETCLFRGDLDNNSRISCYLYQPEIFTKNPGLEANGTYLSHNQLIFIIKANSNRV